MAFFSAKRLLADINFQVPWRSRLEFVKAIAALASVYNDEMDRIIPGPNRSVRDVLYSAVAPDRCEWYFNNIRLRHRLGSSEIGLLPSGTTSNEALHAEINSWFRQTQKLHESTILLKFRIMRTAKQLPHVSACSFPTMRQMSYQIVSTRVACKPLFSSEQWKAWCDELLDKHVRKAALPLNEQRKTEQLQLRKRPAHMKKPATLARTDPKRKRTPFSLARSGRLVLQGVKPSRTVLKKT